MEKKEFQTLLADTIKQRDTKQLEETIKNLEKEREQDIKNTEDRRAEIGQKYQNASDTQEEMLLRVELHEMSEEIYQVEEQITKTQKGIELIGLIEEKESVEKNIELFAKEFGLTEDNINLDIDQLENEIKTLDDRRVELSILLSDRSRDDHDELQKEYQDINKKYALLKYIRNREDLNNKIEKLSNEIGIDYKSIDKETEKAKPDIEIPTETEQAIEEQDNEEPQQSDAEQSELEDDEHDSDDAEEKAKKSKKDEEQDKKTSTEQKKQASQQKQASNPNQPKDLIPLDKCMVLPADFKVGNLERGPLMFMAKAAIKSNVKWIRRLGEKAYDAMIGRGIAKALKKGEELREKGEDVLYYRKDLLPQTEEEFYAEVDPDNTLDDKYIENLYNQYVVKTFEKDPEKYEYKAGAEPSIVTPVPEKDGNQASQRSEKAREFAESLDPENGDYHQQDPEPKEELTQEEIEKTEEEEMDR